MNLQEQLAAAMKLKKDKKEILQKEVYKVARESKFPIDMLYQERIMLLTDIKHLRAQKEQLEKIIRWNRDRLKLDEIGRNSVSAPGDDEK